MTNREMLIQALQNYNGKYEEGVIDYLDCPYIFNCPNEKNGIDFNDRSSWIDGCAECKREWLGKEFDA